MRKLMNKKGFSLVELMIVVVIMGILIAVAIPLYGAITKNANNKTCSTNIKNIKTAAANYYANNDQTKATKAALQSMMDDGAIPKCPLGGDYGVIITAKGNAIVLCNNTADDHAPKGNVKDTVAASITQYNTDKSATGNTEIQQPGTAVA